MSEVLEIRSSQDSAKLVLETEGSLPAESFLARLSVPGLVAATRVHAFQPDGTRMSDLFRTMAANWRGWEGRMGWDSNEGELGLLGSVDATGHVSVVVRLQDSTSYNWSVRAELLLDAGQLEELAQAFVGFEGNLNTEGAV